MPFPTAHHVIANLLHFLAVLYPRTACICVRLGPKLILTPLQHPPHLRSNPLIQPPLLALPTLPLPKLFNIINEFLRCNDTFLAIDKPNKTPLNARTTALLRNLVVQSLALVLLLRLPPLARIADVRDPERSVAKVALAPVQDAVQKHPFEGWRGLHVAYEEVRAGQVVVEDVQGGFEGGVELEIGDVGCERLVFCLAGRFD